MRLHTLTLQAIGPFAGRFTLDFASLASSGIFLLEGPTGAGKTTIIDAVVFAIYGDLSGPDASKGRLHSRHAGAGVTPEVDLVFECGAGVFRVRRQPAHWRPKQRGSGLTQENEHVWLTRLASPDASEGEEISTKSQEANPELTRLVGLTRHQFTQTVVLPQGQFSTFLKAKPDDRKEVLQEIFGTWVFHQVQEELAERARAYERQRSTLQQAVRHRAEALVSAAELDEEAAAVIDALAAESDLTALLTRAGGLAAQAGAAAQDAEEVESARGRAAQEAAEALESRKMLAASLTQRREFLKRRETLEAAAADIDALERACDAARAAEPVQAIITRLAKTEARHRAARDACDAWRQGEPDGPATERAASLVALMSDGTVKPDLALSRAAEQALTSAARLDAAVETERGLPRRRQELMQERTDLAERRQKLAERRVVLDERSAGWERLKADHAAATATAGGREAAELRLEAATKLAQQARAAVDHEARLATARREEEAATKAERRATQEYRRLREAWLSDMAGSLASELVDGEACRVCGAIEHPDPAVLADDHVTAERVELAESAMKQRADELANSRAVTTSTAQALEAARADSQGLSVDDAQVRVDDASRALEAARAAGNRADALGRELDDFEQATTALRDGVDLEERTLATADSETSALERQLETDARSVSDQADGATSAEDLRAWWHLRAERAAEGATRARELTEADEARRDLTSERDRALVQAGFSDAAAVAAAAMSPDDAASAHERVRKHREDWTFVTNRLAEPDLANLTGDEAPDVPAAESAAQAARDASREATRQAEQARSRRQATSRELDRLREVERERDELDAKAGPVLRMSELARAREGNHDRVQLSTYVLLRRFEEVIDHANARLGVMTDGRYELRRASGAEGGRRAQAHTGLGLEVIDHHVDDSTRDPHTLSGGETFIFSLALALGLADAVTSEAGGIDLQTLFIDEGFGTLDPEKLDLVMRELARLQAGGRLVGVVSHVEELKSQIPDRISVRRGRRGPSTVSTTFDAVAP